MKLVGKTAIGAQAFDLAADVKRVAYFDFPAGVRIPKLSAYMDGLASALDLTALGTPITDLMRAQAVQGDGLASPDSSYGLWPASMNAIPNGGFETNLTGWGAYQNGGTGTLTRTNEVPAKFGSWCGKLTATSAISDLGAVLSMPGGAVAVAPGQVWTLTGYSRAAATPKNFVMIAVFYTAGDVQVGASVAGTPTSNAVGSWTRAVPLTVTVPATAAKMTVYISHNSLANGAVHYVDGIQAEQKAYATPYMHTDGATASRAATYMDAPSTTLDQTQGWVAMRVREGMAAFSNESPAYFGWDLWYRGLRLFRASNASITFQRAGGPTSSPWNGVGGAIPAVLSVGQKRTIIFAWTATQVKGAADGASFVVTPATPDTIPPSPMPSVFHIGAQAIASEVLNGDMLWFACGLGTLTDADSAALHAFGDAGPTSPSQLPGNATLLWQANDAVASVVRSNADQVVRAVIYEPDNDLLAQGSEVAVPGNRAASWIDLPFPTSGGVLIPAAGRYAVGVHAGPVNKSARIYGDNPYPGRTNLCTNPSFEGGSTVGWDTTPSVYLNAGGTMWLSQVAPLYGEYVLLVGTDAAQAFEGVRYQPVPLVAGHTYTASFYIWLNSGATGMNCNFGSVATGQTSATFTAVLGQYIRVVLTLTATGTGDATLAINTATAGVRNWQIDGVLIEEATTALPYFEDKGKSNADTYAGGAAAVFGSASALPSDLSIFATYISDWVTPDTVDEDYARLPFELAQDVLGEGAAVATYSGEADWHGTKIDPERGSFCIVRTDGPLAHLVGERIRVTSLESVSRSVVAYVHNESSELLQDLSLTRKLYLELALLSTDSVPVKVEVLE